jgi:hypothetical protein
MVRFGLDFSSSEDGCWHYFFPIISLIGVTVAFFSSISGYSIRWW